MYMINKILILLITLSQYITNADIRTWKNAYNYDAKENWVENKGPCETSRIIFPLELQRISIFSAQIHTIREIILPRHGKLLLPENMDLTLTEEYRTNTCDGSDRFFKNIQLEPWLNPNNWISQNFNNNIALPTLEKLPCRYDTVIFPVNSTFRVKLPELNEIVINELQLNGRQITNNEFQEYLFTSTGSEQFTNNEFQNRETIIQIEPKQCTDVTGCVCHPYSPNKYKYLEDLVCLSIKEHCVQPQCLTPVKPIGECCEICGSVILMQYTNGFKMAEFQKYVQNFMKKRELQNTFYYISKVLFENINHIQIIIKENDKSEELSHKIANELTQQLKTANLGLVFISIKTSGMSFNPNYGNVSFAIVFGTLFAVILIFTIIYFIFYSPEKYGTRFRLPNFNLPPFRSPPVFARFENTPQEITLEFDAPCIPNEEDRAFDNPLYAQHAQVTTLDSVEEIDTAEDIAASIKNLDTITRQPEKVTEDNELLDLS